MKITDFMKQKNKLNMKLKQCEDEVLYRNCKNFLAFTEGGMMITGSIVIIGLLLSSYTAFVKEFVLFFAYLVVQNRIASYCMKKQTKHIVWVFYGSMLPIYLCGIMMGTFLDAGRPAITIIILMCVLTLFIIDYPWRMTLFIGLIMIIFAVCSFVAKESSVFMSDMINLIIYFCIAIGVNYFMLADHIESAENYVLARRKSEIDLLTGIYNRGTGEQKISELMKQSVKGAFVLVDIDNFKKVNDTYGHQVGDDVIRRVADAIRETFASKDIVCRLGGDEFAVYAIDLIDKDVCGDYFQRLIDRLQKVQIAQDQFLEVGISLGCTICMHPQIGFEQVYHFSDVGLYEAKMDGKKRYVICEA